VFVAGAGGAVGNVLCRLLLADGWMVHGSTRFPERAAQLRALGVEPVILDVFERTQLIEGVARAAPTHVVHQLTDLPQVFDAAALEAARERNARIREVGTEYLAEAAQRAGVRRFVAQSIAFAYAPGPVPHTEEDALNPGATALATLERLTLAGPYEGVVLRYGRFYGPRTWSETPQPEVTVHVEAAADAARRALTRGGPGIYNIAEPGGNVCIEKAKTALGWDPAFRISR